MEEAPERQPGEVPAMFRDDSMLDDSHSNQELGINVYTAPSISKIFAQLDHLPAIPEDYVLRKRRENLPLDAGKLVLSPTRTYAPIVKKILDALRPEIHGMVHCSGGAQTKVMHFVENVKPLVLNATNNKTIAKLLKTPDIEQWQGKKIQLYVQHGIKAFGDIVDAVRVRDFLPVEKELKCADCGGTIKGFGKTSAEVVAKHTLSTYGRMLCSECATKAKEAATPKGEGAL